MSFTKRNYDSRSRRLIQLMVGSATIGAFGRGAAQAVANFQSSQGLPPTGKVDKGTLTSLLHRFMGGAEAHLIHLVTDFFNIDITTTTLGVYHDKTLSGPAALGTTTFEGGGLRVIKLGSLAFMDSSVLAKTIRKELSVPAPVSAATTPRPTLLTATQAKAAVAFNQRRLSDARSVSAVQAAVGARVQPLIERDLVERIADLQHVRGTGAVNGKLDFETLDQVVVDMGAAGHANSIIRVLVDYFNLRLSEVIGIHFDPSLTKNARTEGKPNGPSVVRVGPSAFRGKQLTETVHILAHELEHARLTQGGLADHNEQEFLGEAIEIMSVGMREEPDFSFFEDALRLIDHWSKMAADRRRYQWRRFEHVRRKVRRRYQMAPPSIHKTTFASVVFQYDMAVRPR